jgi:hypothetical protein
MHTFSAAQTPSGDLGSNFGVDTRALINHADRIVFLIPFSHWDTDWHDTFEAYSQKADQNILSAIQLAKQYLRFRFTLEQVLFVQHFWDTPRLACRSQSAGTKTTDYFCLGWHHAARNKPRRAGDSGA